METPATAFTRGDRVRYIGPNEHYGLEGRVRQPYETDGGDLIDVDFDLPGRRRKKIRKVVAPQNLERLERTEVVPA
jgi:hypothetical protein